MVVRIASPVSARGLIMVTVLRASSPSPATTRPAMSRTVAVLSLSLAFVLAALASARAEAKVPPIKKLEKVAPKPSAFKASSWRKPIVLRSAKEAAAHFSEEALPELTKQVDFGEQFVLLFAWRGSGQDRLRYAVAESYPEQVFFTYKAGRTRDLRPHVHLYALRSNVTWRVKAARR